MIFFQMGQNKNNLYYIQQKMKIKSSLTKNTWNTSFFDLWYNFPILTIFERYHIKGIVWGYLIFSASAKINCWILELCIWLVSKLIGLPLLKRTPHQSKAEACYRQITCFFKKNYETRFAKTMILRTSSRIYITYETHKKGASIRVLVSRS